MDERIKGEYRKIYAELLSIIMVFVALSLLVKFFFFDMGIAECRTEFIILIGSPLYMAARQYMLGIDPAAGMQKAKRKKKALVSLACALACFLAAAYVKHGRMESWAWEYILSFAAAYVFIYFISEKAAKYFSDKKSRKYED